MTHPSTIGTGPPTPYWDNLISPPISAALWSGAFSVSSEPAVPLRCCPPLAKHEFQTLGGPRNNIVFASTFTTPYQLQAKLVDRAREYSELETAIHVASAAKHQKTSDKVKSSPKDRPPAERCIKYALRLTKRQKSMIDMWMAHYRVTYNAIIHFFNQYGWFKKQYGLPALKDDEGNLLFPAFPPAVNSKLLRDYAISTDCFFEHLYVFEIVLPDGTSKKLETVIPSNEDLVDALDSLKRRGIQFSYQLKYPTLRSWLYNTPFDIRDGANFEAQAAYKTNLRKAAETGESFYPRFKRKNDPQASIPIHAKHYRDRKHLISKIW